MRGFRPGSEGSGGVILKPPRALNALQRLKNGRSHIITGPKVSWLQS